MSKRADSEFVNDMREAIQRISSYLGEISYETFLADTKTQDAVVRNIEIIGEAAKAISEQLRASSPHIPWKSLAGMRDRLIHHYFGVNLDVEWLTPCCRPLALARHSVWREDGFELDLNAGGIRRCLHRHPGK